MTNFADCSRIKGFIGASAGNIQTFCDAFEQLPRRFTWRTAKFLIEQFTTFSIRQKFRCSLRNRDSQQPSASTLLIQRRSSIAKHRTNPPIFPKIPREPAFASGRFSIVFGQREVGFDRVLKRQIFRFSRHGLGGIRLFKSRRNYR